VIRVRGVYNIAGLEFMEEARSDKGVLEKSNKIY